MAEVKVIEVQIKSNIDGATTSVSKFKAGLKDATTQSKELGSTLQGDKQSEFINKLGDGVGKLNPAFGSAVKGANGLLLKMWELVANPVGAILAGIVVTAKFLYEAFQSSVAGGKELKAIFAGISAVGEQVKDAIFGLGRALIGVTTAAYKFITLDFKGAAESMKEANREASNSYKQLGNAVDGTTAKIIYNLTKQQQANDKAKKIQDLTQSETNKLLVQSREILTDETASINEKKKALAEVTKAEKASSAEKTRIAAEDLRIIKERAKALGGEAEKKMKGEIREATIALNVAETENAMTGIKLNKQKKILGREEAAAVKEKNDAIAASNKEVTDKRIAQEKADALALKTFNDDLLKNQQQMNVNKVNSEIQEALDEKERKRKSLEDISAMVDALEAEDLNKAKIISDEKIKIAQAEAQQKKDIQDAAFALASGAVNFLKEIGGKNKAIQKAAIIAENAIGIGKMIIANNAANIGALATPQAILTSGASAVPVIAMNNITTALGVATTIASTAKALQAVGGGGAGGAPSVGGAGGVAAAPAAPAFNVVGASPTNQLAQTIGNQQQQPIKAYVVSNDVTTAQSLDRNIISSASIG